MLTDRIDFISEYCDRWCERCAFTTRCSAYAVQAALGMCGDLTEALQLAVGRPMEAGATSRPVTRIQVGQPTPQEVRELEAEVELHEKEGMGDAPWPPQYKKQAGEPPRVQPSRKRTSKHPLIEIGRAIKKEDALAGLERWRARHPDAAAHLEPADVLVDAMRGRFATWTRIRLNLQHVPDALRPVQETLDPDDAPKSWGPDDVEEWKRMTSTRRRRPRKAASKSHNG